MSSRESGWIERDLVRRRWSALFMVSGLVVVGFGIDLLARGDLLALSVFLIGVPFVLTPWWTSRKQRPPYDYEGRHGAGLALPLRAMSWPFIVCLPAWATIIVLVVIGVWRDGDGGVAGGVFATLFGGFFAVCLLGIAAGGVTGRVMKNRMILMDVDGIFVNAPGGSALMPWHAVQSIRRRSILSPGKYQTKADDSVRNYIEFSLDKSLVEGKLLDNETHAVEEGLVFDRDLLAMDPHLAVAVMEFYLKNPEERGDLRTVVALDRVASIARRIDPA